MENGAAAGNPPDDGNAIQGNEFCVCLPVSALVFSYYDGSFVDSKDEKFFPAVLQKVLINCEVEEGVGGRKVKAEHLFPKFAGADLASPSSSC